MSDLEGKCFIRMERGLVPADIHADEWLGKLPFKREVILTSREPRNPAFHRWFFALLTKVHENQEGRWESVEDLRDALKMATGHFEVRQDMIGEYYRAPKSMSYASMSSTVFKTFVERCLDQIAEHTGIYPETLMQEVNAEQGGSPWSGEQDK